MKTFRALPISAPPDNCPDDVDDVDIFKLDPRYSFSQCSEARALVLMPSATRGRPLSLTLFLSCGSVCQLKTKKYTINVSWRKQPWKWTDLLLLDGVKNRSMS